MLAVCRISPPDQGAKCQGSARGFPSRCLQPAAGGCSNSVSTLHLGGLGDGLGESERLASVNVSGRSTSSGNGLDGEDRLRQTVSTSNCIALSNREMQSSPWIDCERGASAVKQCEQDAGMKSQISQTSSHLGRTARRAPGIQSSPKAATPLSLPCASRGAGVHSVSLGAGRAEVGGWGGGAEPLSEQSRARPQHF